MSMTARDLITDAMIEIGAIAPGFEVPSADEQSAALRRLNRMFDNWSNQGLLVPAIVQETFAFTPDQQSYTMGPGGNFNTARPLKIRNILIEPIGTTPVVDLQAELINSDQWAAIVIKGVQSTIPRRVFYDGAYPLQNIYFWPLPTLAQNIVIYSWKPLASIAAVSTTVDLPPGYELAIVSNLALMLAPGYGKQPSEVLVQMATNAIADIKRANIKIEVMAQDASVIGKPAGFNWLTGGFS